MKTRNWILFVALAVFAVPTFAQQYATQPYIEPDVYYGGEAYAVAMVMDNPCTAETDWIDVDYNVDIYQQLWQTSNGTNRVQLEENMAMDGRNQYGYATYAYGWSKSDIAYGSQPVEDRKYHKVNTPDQFHVVTVIQVDPVTGEMKVSVETACGDGSPDSKE
jgi:hypothetical protein